MVRRVGGRYLVKFAWTFEGNADKDPAAALEGLATESSALWLDADEAAAVLSTADLEAATASGERVGGGSGGAAEADDAMDGDAEKPHPLEADASLAQGGGGGGGGGAAEEDGGAGDGASDGASGTGNGASGAVPLELVSGMVSLLEQTINTRLQVPLLGALARLVGATISLKGDQGDEDGSDDDGDSDEEGGNQNQKDEGLSVPALPAEYACGVVVPALIAAAASTYIGGGGGDSSPSLLSEHAALLAGLLKHLVEGDATPGELGPADTCRQGPTHVDMARKGNQEGSLTCPPLLPLDQTARCSPQCWPRLPSCWRRLPSSPRWTLRPRRSAPRVPCLRLLPGT